MNLQHTHTDNLPGIQTQIQVAFESDIKYNDISGERCNEPNIDESAEWLPIDLTSIKAPKIEPTNSDAGMLVTTTLESAHACCAIEKLEMLAYMQNKLLCMIYTTNNGQRRLVKKARLTFASSEGDTAESGNVYGLTIVSRCKHEPKYITGAAPVVLPPIVIEPPVVVVPTETVLWEEPFTNIDSSSDSYKPVGWTDGNDGYNNVTTSTNGHSLRLDSTLTDGQNLLEYSIIKIFTDSKFASKKLRVEIAIKEYIVPTLDDPTPQDPTDGFCELRITLSEELLSSLGNSFTTKKPIGYLKLDQSITEPTVLIMNVVTSDLTMNRLHFDFWWRSKFMMGQYAFEMTDIKIIEVP